MNFLATGLSRMLSTYRTTLFVCVTTILLVNSCVRSYPTETGGNGDSGRLEKLRWIAKQLTRNSQDPFVDDETLTANTLTFIRSLTESIGTAHNTLDSVTKADDPSDITTPDRRQTRLEVLKRVYRQTSGTPLEQFRQALTNLHTVMVPFLQTLKARYIQGANSVLNNVVLIPQVLPPNDPAFPLGDFQTILKKFSILEQSLRAVLDHSLEYVQSAYKPWFNDQFNKVDYALNAALLMTLGLPFHLDDSGMTILSCGVGCTNTGVREIISYDLLNAMYTLVTFLVNKKMATLPS